MFPSDADEEVFAESYDDGGDDRPRVSPFTINKKEAKDEKAKFMVSFYSILFEYSG